MSAIEGLVLSRAGGRYRVQTGVGIREASLRGRVKQHGDLKVLVGDRVRLDESADALTIEEVLPRTSLLQRRYPGRKRGVREIAANVDRVVAVGAAADPAWDQHMMDRFVVVAEANGLPVLIVLNKVDLVSNAQELVSTYRSVGYDTLMTSAVTGEGITELADELAGRVSLFTGSTGVGKSSLLNTVEPGLSLKTSPVSQKSRAGRHTTVTAEMYPLSVGGYVVDTPGLRDIGLWGVEPDEVLRAFPEIREAATGCRFDDCHHLSEPGCAVKEAVDVGRIDADRLKSLHSFLAEAREASRDY